MKLEELLREAGRASINLEIARRLRKVGELRERIGAAIPETDLRRRLQLLEIHAALGRILAGEDD